MKTPFVVIAAAVICYAQASQQATPVTPPAAQASTPGTPKLIPELQYLKLENLSMKFQLNNTTIKNLQEEIGKLSEEYDNLRRVICKEAGIKFEECSTQKIDLTTKQPSTTGVWFAFQSKPSPPEEPAKQAEATTKQDQK